MRLRILVFGLLAQVFLTGFMFAQSDRGAITGTVSDPTGAVIPGVQVTATELATKVQTTATTSDVGLYSILNQSIGKYSVSFTKQGFKTLARSGITVAISQVVQLDAVMQVGAVTESVTVTGEASILQTRQTELSTTMKSQVVTDLPLSISGGRQIELFALAITPGVEGDTWTTHVGGSMAFTKEVLIDGTSAVIQIGGHIGESSPTMEAIQEFRVETSGVRAADGRSGGGAYKFTLKSGTNSLHGSAFGFLHNEVLNANTWQSNFRGEKRATDRQQVYGFSLGGPIIKNKTFAFGAFEKYMQERFVLGEFNKTVPTPDFLDGDFSALLDTSTQLDVDAGGNPVYKGAIFQPGTGLVYPDNKIPSGDISTVANNIVNIFRTSYQPMVPGAIKNNSALPRQNDPWFHQTQLTFKVDHNFSEISRLSSSFIWTERPRILVDQGGIWDPSAPLDGGGPLANTRKQEVTSRAFRLSHTYSFSPNVLNFLGFTYGRYRNPSQSIAATLKDWPAEIGLGETGASNFPEINFGNTVNGVWTEQIGAHWSDYYVSNRYIIDDSLTWIKGRHTLKFGGMVSRLELSSHASTPYLNFGFNNMQTGAPGTPYQNNVGFGFASFLLGAVESASQQTPWDLYGRRHVWGLYVQDDFKVSSKLTLTMDLRWDQTGPLTEKYGNWANFDTRAISQSFGVPGTLAFASSGKDSFEGKRDWKQFGPHVGVAYQLANRIVFRGAYGIFYSPIGMNYWFGVPYGFAPGSRGTNRVPATQDLSPAFNWDDGYPGQFVPGSKDPDFAQWGMVSVNPKALQAGYTHQWTLGTEFELTKDFRLDLTYMGNLGRRLQSGYLERNNIDKTALGNLLRAGKEWNAVWDEGSAADAGVPYPYQGFGSYAFAALLDYPQVWQNWNWGGPVLFVGSPLGKSDYNAFQAAVTKRAGAVNTQFSYTLARARGNVQGGLGGFLETWWSGPLQDVTPDRLEQEAKAPLGYDQTHVFKGYVAWELPFGKGRQFGANAGRVANGFIGGWSLSSAFYYRTGYPMTVNSSYWYPGRGDGDPIYAVRDPNGNYSRQFNESNFNFANTADQANTYFNSSLFSNPAYGDFGNDLLYRSDFRGFGWSNEDVMLMKNFRFGGEDRFRLQFRVELYNIFNRHHFSDPDTGIASSTFGHVINLSGSPREGQIGARFEW